MILDTSNLKQFDARELNAGAEEKVERTNPYKGEFSPSSLSYAQCMRRFMFEKLYGLRSTHPAYPLLFGIAIHKGVEFFYKNIGSKEHTFEQVKAGAVQQFVKEWASYQVQGDNKRNLDVGIILMGMYCDLYQHEDAKFESADIEGSQWISMPNGTMLLCKLDRTVVSDGQVAVVDSKSTASYLNPNYFRQFDNHIATSLYYYAMESVFGRCDYILIDAIRTPINGPKSQTPQFARRNFLRTEEQINDAIITYCAKTSYMMEGMGWRGAKLMQHFYCDQNRCADYGGCPYLGICKHGILHPSVDVDFKFGSEEKRERAMEDFDCVN